MVRWFSFLIVSGFLAAAVLGSSSCKHFPVDIVDDNPTDTIPPPPPDDTTGVPCDPNVVYFDQQVLPILISNCAMSGCHDAASHQDGVVLESYESVMNTADIKPFDLGDSELYEVITENDPDKQMPPLSNSALNADQIALIAKWIQQGAKDLDCNPDAGGCDTSNVTFSAYVFPVMQNYCLGCHNGYGASGGINLNAYQDVKTVALDGRLYGVITHATGYSPMPQNSAKLSDCRIAKIKAWIDAGAPNN
jgi:mono/diheme cytochrome c family protein